MNNKILSKAIKLLSMKDYSTMDLRAKLSRSFAELPQEEISDVISYLQSIKYLDDTKYAKLLARKYYRKGYAKSLVLYFVKKEVGLALTEEDWMDLIQGLENQHQEKLKSILDKYETSDELSFDQKNKNKAKIIRKLYALGHSIDNAKNIISETAIE